MKPLLGILALLFTYPVFSQQLFTGLMTDNYVSSNVASYNPSSIVDSKSKISIGLNYCQNTISNFVARPYGVYLSYQEYSPFSKARFDEHSKPGYRNYNANFDVLNFKYEIDHKNAIGYSLRMRSYKLVSGIGDVWSQNAAIGYDQKEQLNVPEDMSGFSLSRVDFTEHVLVYARTILEEKTRFLKAGISIKLLNGLIGDYFYVNSGTYAFTDSMSSNAQITGLDADFGRYENGNQNFFRNSGLGFDLGATYEIRPDSDLQYYEMDGRKKNVRYDINKYKIKLAASITDIGSIRFMKNTSSYNFTNSSTNADMTKLFRNTDFTGNNFKYVEDYLQNPQAGGVKSDQQEAEYRFTLPTTFHLMVDYRIKKDLYVNYNASVPIYLASDKTKTNHVFIQTITPRIEKAKYAIMLPLSMQGNGTFYLGLAGRIYRSRISVFGGSNNISLFYGQKASLSHNFFVGFAFNFLYEMPSDIDMDKVSDEKDACPDDYGLYEYQGCPDTDGDEIPDKEDFCIYHKGTRETNGCPDGDGDGIIDMNDMCPSVPGLGVHYGCPDRDYDGVIDMADQCPDVPGIELNNGCPFENPGCCMDNDGDGVSNNADKCPDHAGSVYNDGCPIDSLNINKIKLQDQKSKLDPNHAGEQIRVLKNNDTIRNLITSQEELSKLLKSKNILREHNVYFEHDQATLTDDELRLFDQFFREASYADGVSLMVIGHTDKDGSLDYNLILSKKRAETVKRKLIEYGFPADKIELYYFGETKSLHKGSYSKEQKRMDRRVEIKLVQQ